MGRTNRTSKTYKDYVVAVAYYVNLKVKNEKTADSRNTRNSTVGL